MQVRCSLRRRVGRPRHNRNRKRTVRRNTRLRLRLGPRLDRQVDILRKHRLGHRLPIQIFPVPLDVAALFVLPVDPEDAIDRPDARWNALIDADGSNGVWSDANLGHRFYGADCARGWLRAHMYV